MIDTATGQPEQPTETVEQVTPKPVGMSAEPVRMSAAQSQSSRNEERYLF